MDDGFNKLSQLQVWVLKKHETIQKKLIMDEFKEMGQPLNSMQWINHKGF